MKPWIFKRYGIWVIRVLDSDWRVTELGFGSIVSMQRFFDGAGKWA
jgi:hypothetical protein